MSCLMARPAASVTLVFAFMSMLAFMSPARPTPSDTALRSHPRPPAPTWNSFSRSTGTRLASLSTTTMSSFMSSEPTGNESSRILRVIPCVCDPSYEDHHACDPRCEDPIRQCV